MTTQYRDGQAGEPGTYFASAKRAGADELRRQIELLSRNPVIDVILATVPGLLAILNEDRQILAVNDALCAQLGLDGPAAVIGLRPGEALRCVYVPEGPGGCGTSPYCARCGAVVAILACLNSNRAEQRECAITREQSGLAVDLYFQVRCHPITVESTRLLCLFLRDTTAQQKEAALERAFFGDVSVSIAALLVKANILAHKRDRPAIRQLSEDIGKHVLQLAKEVELQRILCEVKPQDYQIVHEEISAAAIVQELGEHFGAHPAARGKTLERPAQVPAVCLCTDPALLKRILISMLVNAFEATPENGTVRFWAEAGAERVSFCVWNAESIPPDVARRIFQRNFSTKPGPGRGLGTYSMKHFGETYLHGKVEFASAHGQGTVFRLTLPLTSP